MNIVKLHKVQQAVDSVQIITRFFYNYTWILALIWTYTREEILRLDVIRFATNYITLDSYLDKKVSLCQLFVSAEGRRVDMQGTTLKKIM